VGATSTLVARHLFKAKVSIPPKLATALLYGIKSDTQDLGRQAGPRDIDAFLKLYAMADKKAIPKIVYAPVPRRYFHVFEQALRKAKVCGRLIVTHLGAVTTPDIVAEVADLLLRLEECDWAAVTSRYQGKLLVSIRTSDPGGQAGRIIQKVIGDEGSAGGHGMMAGGSIPTVGMTKKVIGRLETELQADLMGEVAPGADTCEPLGRE
jgi:nanoRNase/pAp phosphatase (c-di-AMP/oligoRNAs hydrolase)